MTHINNDRDVRLSAIAPGSGRGVLLRFVRTTEAAPEQWDVYRCDDIGVEEPIGPLVAYLRIRNGELIVHPAWDVPDGTEKHLGISWSTVLVTADFGPGWGQFPTVKARDSVFRTVIQTFAARE